MITFDQFLSVEMYVGTVIEAGPNPKARKPAYVLTIDFGALGIKKSSAQITLRYTPTDLIGTQVVAVMNFPPKNIAGITSEVLVLGAVGEGGDVVLLSPTHKVENGIRIA